MIRYALPFPPSTNNLFVNAGKRRVKSDAYSAWRRTAGNMILEQGRKRLKGPVSLAIYVVRPDRRKRDLSNLIKGCEDLLVEMQVIEDDSLVQRLTVEWADAGSFECLVMIQQAEKVAS